METNTQQSEHFKPIDSSASFTFDPEIAAAIKELAKAGPPPVIERGDWKSVRESGNAGWRMWADTAPIYPDVHKKSFYTATPDGASIELRWYSKDGPKPGSAIVYAHGGGMILASLDLYDFVVSEYVSRSGVPFLAVDYRLAPESKGVLLAEDVYLGVSWLVNHAPELEVDISRIAIMGDSGGGAPAAGVPSLRVNEMSSWRTSY